MTPPLQSRAESGSGSGSGSGSDSDAAPEEVSVRVLLFAGARELAGCAEGVLAGVPARTDADALLRRVTDAFALRPMAGSFILALNHDYVLPGDELRVRDGDEVAVIPPLSGG